MKRLIAIGIALSFAFTANAQSWLEKIATTIIADQFGIDNRKVIYVQQQNHIPYWELGPVFEGSYYFKRSPSDVWRLRNQGLGWGQVAQRMGMHPGTFNKLRKQGAFDRDRFWIDSYSRRFDYPRESLVVLHKRAGSLQDVLAAVIVGELSNRDPREVYDQFTTSRSWNRVTDHYNVEFVDWRRVSRPVRVSMPVRAYVNPRPVATSSKVKVKSSSGKAKGVHGKKGSPPGHSKLKSGSGTARVSGHSGKGKGAGNSSKAKGHSGGGKGHGKGKGGG